ncbi:hypothetical protein DPMN_014747 [Dreissena polymorpha]|uniref:Uncharacterized protein n=1 Tax=Dreissena polymorpha TaxID=45954 RepID=A0A9D4N6K3_DREPO|nr:hypothetical protein DPMN_014747 [Dreissena polymorpha]
MADFVLRSRHLEGYTRLLSSSAAHHRSSWEYLPHAQNKPPGQDTKSQANAQSNTYRHRLIHLSSWKYLHQGIYPPGNTYLREHVCTPPGTGQQESMVIPSGICIHPIGSTSCSMVPSHERRKPGTTLQGGVAPDVTGTTLPSLLFLGRPPTHKGIVPPNVIVNLPKMSHCTRGSILTISRTPMPLS